MRNEQEFRQMKNGEEEIFQTRRAGVRSHSSMRLCQGIWETWSLGEKIVDFRGEWS